VKLAAGLATGALALGAAGAYAAASNNTVPVTNAQPVTVKGGTTPTFSLISLSGTKTTTIDATKFTNPGQCVSTFAKNKDLALTPAAGTTKISKNFHGKLMSTVQSWCQQFNKSKASTTDTQTTETPDATEPADSTDSSDSSNSSHGQSGLSHGHGQAHGRGHSNA
jgi:hypothetical protein